MVIETEGQAMAYENQELVRGIRTQELVMQAGNGEQATVMARTRAVCPGLKTPQWASG
jgi:hypothetical protein